jgi:nitronate monooxygenase
VNLILEWEQHERVAACIASEAGVVSFFWGDPAPYVDAVHEAGGLVVHTVGSAEEARRVVDAGVDVVVAQGVEAGGHVWGEIATMPLVPAVVDAVDVPVLATGGIADGRGLASALALGASGAWIGTRFVASAESAAHDRYKDEVVGSESEDAVLVTLFDAEWPNAKHRVLRTEAVRTWERAGRPGSGERPGEGESIGTTEEGFPLMRYSAMLPANGVTGDLESLAFYAGQSGGLIGEVKPAGDIVREIAGGAIDVMRASAASLRE